MSTDWEIFAGAVALIVAMWGRVRAVVEWAIGWVLVTKKTDRNLGVIVLDYLGKNNSVQLTRDATYSSVHAYVKPLEKIYRIVWQAMGGCRQMFWRRGRPVWYRPLSETNTEDNYDISMYCFSFSFIRGTCDWDQLLLDAVDYAEELRTEAQERRDGATIVYHYGSVNDPLTRGSARNGHRNDEAEFGDSDSFFGKRLLRWSRDDVKSGVGDAALNNLSLQPSLLKLMEELSFWHRSRKWYEARGIPWRRGYVFYGVPGTGKTSMARAIAEHLSMPIHLFDLPSMNNRDFREAWKSMLQGTPCVALLEDLDADFKGRESTMDGGLTFDCLLNTVDGVERTSGVLLIITTNHLEAIDEALADRPGRIDRKIEFTGLDHAGRVKMATRILDDARAAEVIARDGDGDSAAAFQERCFRAALQNRFSDDA